MNVSNYKIAFFFIFSACWLTTCMTPNFDTDNDAGYVECTDEFCQNWCEGNFCRKDAGLSDWGACIGTCAEETDGCSCRDLPCDPVNCNDWCVNDKGASNGVCVEYECMCDFEPDPDLDSGSDSGAIQDSGMI